MTDNYNDDSYSGRVRQTAVEILFELELSPQPLEKDNVKDELEHNMDEFEPEIYDDAIKSLHAAGYVESFSGVRDSDQGYERFEKVGITDEGDEWFETNVSDDLGRSLHGKYLFGNGAEDSVSIRRQKMEELVEADHIDRLEYVTGGLPDGI
jgi:hypothetical protein